MGEEARGFGFAGEDRVRIVAWCVMVYVKGKYSGRYEFHDEARARRHAEFRALCFGVLGCQYVVKPLVRLGGGS